ncbi:MAG: peptide chain release factor N(5)-glutamine methyltransferase [Luteibaculaceae bacterium]
MPVSDNRIISVKSYLVRKISAIYGLQEAKQITSLLLEEGLGLDKLDLINPVFRIKEGQLIQLYKWINRLEKNEPIQYILGKTWFYNGYVSTAQGVLIPRPETEELVDYVLKNSKAGSSVLDLCTGSGCIPVALSRANKDFRICALEYFEKPVALAEQNFKALNTTISLLKANVLTVEPNAFNQKFDIITSNPPYVKDSERSKMQNNVLQFEPPEALFVNDSNPLVFYEAIAKLSLQLLADNGFVIVEINEALASDTCSLFTKIGFLTTQVIQDIHGKDRFVVARVS